MTLFLYPQYIKFLGITLRYWVFKEGTRFVKKCRNAQGLEFVGSLQEATKWLFVANAIKWAKSRGALVSVPFTASYMLKGKKHTYELECLVNWSKEDQVVLLDAIDAMSATMGNSPEGGSPIQVWLGWERYIFQLPVYTVYMRTFRWERM